MWELDLGMILVVLIFVMEKAMPRRKARLR